MLFERKEYAMISNTASREEFIKHIGKLANVANKRAKSLTKAVNKGRFKYASTALDSYTKALRTVQEKTVVLPYITTGKTAYKNLSIGQLRKIERRILDFLSSQRSTPKGVIEVHNKTVTALKNRYGLDISKMSNDRVEELMTTVQRIASKNVTQLNSKQVLVYIAHMLSDNSTEAIKDIQKELQEAFPELYEKGDILIDLVRASNLPKQERIAAYKEGLRLKHKYKAEHQTTNRVLQKDW